MASIILKALISQQGPVSCQDRVRQPEKGMRNKAVLFSLLAILGTNPVVPFRALHR